MARASSGERGVLRGIMDGEHTPPCRDELPGKSFLTRRPQIYRRMERAVTMIFASRNSSTFADGLAVGIRLMLNEEASFLTETDLAAALLNRVPGMDEGMARTTADIAWAVTWLHPLAMGFFVFGLCADYRWFEGNSEAYMERLTRITPIDRVREACDLFDRYQKIEGDGGAAVVRGFGIEQLNDFEEQVFSQDHASL